MQPAQEFALEPLERPGGDQPLRSRLKRHGQPGDLILEGVRLEAAFRLADGRYLLMLSDDTPFEEILHVYLLGDALEVRDRAEIGGAYVPGPVQEIAAGPGGCVRFAFAGDRRFELRVRDRPRRWMLRAAPGERSPADLAHGQPRSPHPPLLSRRFKPRKKREARRRVRQRRPRSACSAGLRFPGLTRFRWSESAGMTGRNARNRCSDYSGTAGRFPPEEVVSISRNTQGAWQVSRRPLLALGSSEPHPGADEEVRQRTERGCARDRIVLSTITEFCVC